MSESPTTRAEVEMSVSLFVYAVKPPDEAWKKHKAVWDACEAAGVDVPAETEDWFDGERPSPDGVRVWLGTADGMVKHEAFETNERGARIDLAGLPDGTESIVLEWT